jgi:putative oxidoreductase
MNWLRSFIELIGRFALAAVFVFFGIFKAFHWDYVLQDMHTHGIVEYTEILAAGAIVLEVVAGFALAFGCYKRVAATLLALFIIPTTYFFHNFWMIVDPQQQQLQLIMFVKNLAIFGGLLCLASSPKTE